MMNYCLASNGEMAQKNGNGSIRRGDCYNQMLDNYQSIGGHPRALQDMQQRAQNYPRLINFIQGTKYQENNIVDATTQSMVPYASSSNNNASLIAAAKSGGMLPLALPSGPPEQTSSHNIAPLSHPLRLDSAEKFSFNQGHHRINGFSNPSKSYSTRTSLSLAKNIRNPTPKPKFHNRKNEYFPSLSRGAYALYPSHHIRNKSSRFNNLNHHQRVDMNNFHSGKSIAKSELLPPVQIQNLDMLSYKDVPSERAMKRHLFEFQEEDGIGASTSKRSRMNFSAPPRMKELLLFKDEEKNPFTTLKVKNDAQENVNKGYMDLSLHL